MGYVAGLFRYPVKGCSAVEATEAALTLAGLDHDRAFMVVDAEGHFVSQRSDPRLAVVRPAVRDDGAVLTVSAPGIESLDVAVEQGVEGTGRRLDVRLHGSTYRGVDQGEHAAEWFATLLGRPCRLVRVPPEHSRVTSGETPGTAGFADSSALLLVSRQSLDELNERLVARGAEQVPMARFRPNVVVDGWDEPRSEDRIRHAELGEAGLGFTKVAIRCVVTTIDQDTGERRGPEPLRTLAAYRRVDGGVVMGARFSVTRAGKVSVGDALRVTRWESG